MVDGLNAIAKRYIYQLMSNVQLLVSKTFDSQILIHYFTHTKDISVAKKFQKHMSMDHCKHVVIDHVKIGKYPIKENGKTESIMFRIILMLHTKM